MVNMKDETIILLVTIMAITLLEVVAIIMLHIDGALLSGVIATITGIALKREQVNNYLGKLIGSDTNDRYGNSGKSSSGIRSN